jgi:hypothetical protein
MISDVLVALPSSFLIHFSPAVQRTDNRYIPTDACAPLAADTTLGPLCQWRRDRGDNSFSLHGDGALPFSTSPPSPTVKQLRPNPPPRPPVETHAYKMPRCLTRLTQGSKPCTVRCTEAVAFNFQDGPGGPCSSRTHRTFFF